MRKEKTRVLMVGNGWRANFYHTVAQTLPDEFEVCMIVMRDEQRAKVAAQQRGVPATHHLEEALRTNPDYAVLSVPWDAVYGYLTAFMRAGLPVLCETPPAKDIKEIKSILAKSGEMNGRVQLSEQYFLQPYFRALKQVISDGTIGNVSNMMLSSLHGYHAISIFRQLLSTGFEGCKIFGKQYRFPAMVTDSREGYDYSGTIRDVDRALAAFEFESGKLALLDHSSEQYFSRIRARRLLVQGDKGEINNSTVRFVGEGNVAYTENFYRRDDGVYDLNGWTHRDIQFCGGTLYTNPFYGARLNDDEIAIADCMRRMKVYVETGEDFYSLQEGCWDAYLAFMLDHAMATGATVEAKINDIM